MHNHRIDWDNCDGASAKTDLVYVGLVGVVYAIAPHARRYALNGVIN